MRKMWIVVADAGRAQVLLKVERTNGLSSVKRLDNPSGRTHTVDLVEDQPGRSKKHGSDAKSAMEPPTDPHEQKAKEFAHELNCLLNAAAVRGDYDALSLIAPAHFLGLLRSRMQPVPKRLLTQCLAKDLTQLSLAELECHLDHLLQFPNVAAASD